MRRTALLAVAIGLGILVGAIATAAIQDSSGAPRVQREPKAKEAPVLEPDERILLVWTSGGMAPDFAQRVATLPGVVRVTVASGDLVNLTASFAADGRAIDSPAPGFTIPTDALALDPESYAPFFDGAAQAQLRALPPGQALLGATSAELRGLGPGGVVQLDNSARLTVAGVVDDEVVGAAELVVDATTAPAVGINTLRFLLVAYNADRPETERSIAALVPDTAVRFRAPGETPYLRHGDAVLPQSLIKARFGEFSYRPASGRDVLVDPAWSQENITTQAVPILGRITCHRAVLPAIEGAMRELEERNLAALVDVGGYRGCWVPSVITPGGGLSRHSWGVALDLNFSNNPTGLASAVDPRLIEVMDRWGFISGANYLVPDPGHFEYLRPPRA
jgi:D-alanyl-D-alanine carboxypeptidase